MLRKPGPERGITDIVGHISDQQAAGSIDHLANEVLLREGIDSVALLFARRRIDHGPDVFVLSNSQVSDMVIMVIQAATGRLNMQVVMTGRLAGVVLSHPQRACCWISSPWLVQNRLVCRSVRAERVFRRLG